MTWGFLMKVILASRTQSIEPDNIAPDDDKGMMIW